MNKILLIAPDFYGYWKLIKKGLEQKNTNVDVILFPNSFLYKLISMVSFLSKFRVLLEKKYYSMQLKSISADYETIITIRGDCLPEFFLSKLKSENPNSKVVLYLWDDVRCEESLDIIKSTYFDKVLSFSKFDSEKFGFHFRPMFYSEEHTCHVKDKDIDLFYIASYERDRFAFIKKLLTVLNNAEISYKFIFRCSIFLFLLNKENYKYYRFFHSRKISYNVMMMYLSRSRCSIEVPHPTQKGLTTRPIEALATKTKIITTSKEILNYSLYCPENIWIVDKYNPEVDENWINEPYKEYPAEILKFYSLSQFITDLLK